MRKYSQTFLFFLMGSIAIPHLLFSKSLYEVATLGAATTGSLLEGCVGSSRKNQGQKFYCNTNQTTGFIGPQETMKSVGLHDQPGVFPAPVIGSASVTFQFHCHDANDLFLPVVVRPDGTIYQGLPMTALNSPQTLVISSPAQTGIYTLFVLALEEDSLGKQVIVDASISTKPHRKTSFNLKSFDHSSQDTELISAEFLYIPS